MLIRALVVVIGLIVTATILWSAAESPYEFLTALTLLAIRGVDQLSDVSIGFHQRNGRQDLIAKSFSGRGVAALVPFGLIMQSTGDALAASACSLAFVTVVAGILDFRDLWIAPKADASWSSTISDVTMLVRQTLSIAPYPVVDNLNFNSFRFAMFFGTSTEYMGLIAIALTLFVPFQLLSSAVGFSYLPTAAKFVEEGAGRALRFHILRGVLIGLAIGIGFLVCAWFAPAWAYGMIFREHGSLVRSSTILVALAVLPLPASGFLSLCLISQKAKALYILGPVIAIVGFLTFLGFLNFFYPGFEQAARIAAAFLLGGSIRFVVSLLGAMKSSYRQLKADPA